MTMSPTVRLKLLRPKQHLSSSPMTVRPFAKSCSQALTYDETLNWVNLVEFGDAYFDGSHIPQDTRIDKAFSLSRGCCVDFGLSPEKVRKTGQMSKECAFYKFPAIFLQDTFRY